MRTSGAAVGVKVGIGVRVWVGDGVSVGVLVVVGDGVGVSLAVVGAMLGNVHARIDNPSRHRMGMTLFMAALYTGEVPVSRWPLVSGDASSLIKLLPSSDLISIKHLPAYNCTMMSLS
jgi:hypothetical protein